MPGQTKGLTRQLDNREMERAYCAKEWEAEKQIKERYGG